LRAVPPSHHDLGCAAVGFDAFLAQHPIEAGPLQLPHAAVIQAARLDAAFRQVFLAPAVIAYDPRRANEVGLPRRLRMAALIEEHWPLLELRGASMAHDPDKPLTLPAALPAPQYWLLRRGPRGVAQLALDPQHARHFELLERHELSDALAELEQTCSESERETLPAAVHEFFARGARLAWFISDESNPPLR
jgi:hypothetical protein